ncbi:hypothetical protein NDU88_001105 [Pleurodeles waltl]|uniref:Uncharacterized protein n=1 Tax=Pleurodeles waltl TaxID=8319 RepID=A0AAV7KNL3_PLEWA|nr:hypothetical protein NDU88_001105 [Pleurodeles waltl]
MRHQVAWRKPGPAEEEEGSRRCRFSAEDVSSWKIFSSWVCGSIIASADAIGTSFDVYVVSFPAGPIAFMPADSAEDVIGVRAGAG